MKSYKVNGDLFKELKEGYAVIFDGNKVNYNYVQQWLEGEIQLHVYKDHNVGTEVLRLTNDNIDKLTSILN